MFSLRWLLTPSKTVVEADGLAVHTDNADANVRLTPLLPAGAQLRVWEGSSEPWRGWYSAENGSKLPAPQLEYTWHGKLPALTGMLIVPYRDAMPAIALTMTETAPGCHEFTVTRPGGVDRLTLDLRGDGHACLVRETPGGPARSVALTAAQ